MGADLGMAIRAFRQLRNFQGIMSPAGDVRRLEWRRFGFGIVFLLSQSFKN